MIGARRCGAEGYAGCVMVQMGNKGARGRIAGAVFGLAVAGAALTTPAAAEITTAMTAGEIESALNEAGLETQMSADGSSGDPVIVARGDGVTFVVRALDCSGRPSRCAKLLFFANFSLGRSVAEGDYRVVNKFNDSQVFGRAYILEGRNQVGVDYLIELDGGVTTDHVAGGVARWSDVIKTFVTEFAGGTS